MIDLVKEAGFTWSRIINETVAETVPIADPFCIRPIYITNEMSADEALEKTFPAIDSGGWPVLVFHRIVGGTPTKTTEYNVEDFSTIIYEMHNAGITVRWPSEVVRKANGW